MSRQPGGGGSARTYAGPARGSCREPVAMAGAAR